MFRTAVLSTALLLLLAVPVQAADTLLARHGVLTAMATAPQQTPTPQAPAPQQAPETLPLQATGPIHMDLDLAREHQRFTQFATQQVQRMNSTMLGGKNSMQVQKDGRRYRATYKAIDMDSLVCQVRRSDSNPNYFVGVLLYKELHLESVGQSAEACRRGPFEPVNEKPSRIIYSSKHGGGWQ